MALYTATLEAKLEAPGVCVQVSTYHWPHAHSADQRLSRYSLGLTLSADPVPSQVRYDDEGQDSGLYARLGRLFLLPADVRIQARAEPIVSRSVFCIFERDWFESVTGLGRDWDAHMLAACIDVADAQLAKQVARLAQEAMSPGLASDRFAEGLGTLTAVELARRLRAASDRARSEGLRLLPWQMRRIGRYFEALDTYAPDLGEVAALCGVGERHLRRLFKATTNRTIYEHATEVWTDKAKRMLCEDDIPLKEISARLGFADPGGFSVAFRRAVGVSPLKYRQQAAAAPKPVR
jgi:AraC family transcriptional regulator